MLRIIAGCVLGAIIAGAMGVAMAVQGQVPVDGFQTVDGSWLKGLRDGINFSYQYGITSVGTNQATAFQLPANRFLFEVDTAGSGGATGVALPPCFAGAYLVLDDNTAYTIDVYPSIVNNNLTSAQDTINNTTSTTITTYAAKRFACAKNGVWSAE